MGFTFLIPVSLNKINEKQKNEYSSINSLYIVMRLNMLIMYWIRGIPQVMEHIQKKCQELLQKELNVPKVLLTTSCTHALEMTAILLEIGLVMR